VTAQALSSLIAVVCLAGKMKKESFGKIRLKPEKSIMGEIFVSGVPIALQDGFVQVSFLIITIIANNRGLIPATSVGIVEKIISFLFLVPSAFSSSLSALVAHNVGAGNQRRADQMLKLGLLICVTYGFACAILCQIFPQSIVGAFTREQEVIKAGAQYLRPYAFDCGLAGIHFCFSGYFCGQGHSLISFLHNTISIVLVRVPGAYMLSRMFANTLMPMGIAAPAGSLLSSLICIAYFCYMRNRWQQKGENL
jgi:Na+-driven multidrug efflux pump